MNPPFPRIPQESSVNPGVAGKSQNSSIIPGKWLVSYRITGNAGTPIKQSWSWGVGQDLLGAPPCSKLKLYQMDGYDTSPWSSYNLTMVHRSNECLLARHPRDSHTNTRQEQQWRKKMYVSDVSLGGWYLQCFIQKGAPKGGSYINLMYDCPPPTG